MGAAVLSLPTYALEQASDAELSAASGEGLAFFAQNIELQMPSVAGDYSGVSGAVTTANDFTGLSGYVAAGVNGSKFGASNGLASNGTATTVSQNAGDYGSYVYLSPVGPTASGNKTDVYLYGLSISQNDNITANAVAGNTSANIGSAVPTSAGSVAKAHNALFNTSGAGVNWGRSNDPFAVLVTTSTDVGLDGATTVTVPYLQIAAPQTVTTSAASSAYSANNIRLGAWLNILQYNGASATPNYNTAGVSGAAGPALQLQAIWDGFGINGTVVNIFPTSTGPTVTGNAQLANTLGFSGVLRFNSQPTGVLRLSVAESNTVGGNSIGLFDAYEGIYIQNLHTNLPLGAFNFQPLVLSANNVLSGGNTVPNVTLELGHIPNASAAYNQYYVDYGPKGDGTSTSGTLLSPAVGNCNAVNCSANATHGSITIGDVFLNTTASNIAPTYQLTPRNATNDGSGTVTTGTPVTVTNTIIPGASDALFTTKGTGNSNLAGTDVAGITFKAPGAAGATVNLGTASISGLMINHLKMTLTGL